MEGNELFMRFMVGLLTIRGTVGTAWKGKAARDHFLIDFTGSYLFFCCREKLVVLSRLKLCRLIEARRHPARYVFTLKRSSMYCIADRVQNTAQKKNPRVDCNKILKKKKKKKKQ